MDTFFFYLLSFFFISIELTVNHLFNHLFILVYLFKILFIHSIKDSSSKSFIITL